MAERYFGPVAVDGVATVEGGVIILQRHSRYGGKAWPNVNSVDMALRKSK